MKPERVEVIGATMRTEDGRLYKSLKHYKKYESLRRITNIASYPDARLKGRLQDGKTREQVLYPDFRIVCQKLSHVGLSSAALLR